MEIVKYQHIPAVADMLQSRRFFHAYIITGPAGSGKHELARLMAAAMVCTGTDGVPCLQCAGCHKAMGGIHPDIYTLEKDPDKKEIPVERVRAMRSDVSVMPNEAAAKVYILPEAADLNASGQNALLKVLEEPPAYAHFILVTENAGRLLETIRSRCMEISLTPERTETEPAEESDQLALEFLSILAQNNDMAFLTHVFSLEKLDKLAFAAFGESVIRRAAAMLKNTLSGRPAPLSAAKLTQVIRLFEEFRSSQELNLGVGNMTGLILAELL